MPEFVYWFSTLAGLNDTNASSAKTLRSALRHVDPAIIGAWRIAVDKNLDHSERYQRLLRMGKATSYATLVGLFAVRKGKGLLPSHTAKILFASSKCAPEMSRALESVSAEEKEREPALATFPAWCRLRSAAASGLKLAIPTNVKFRTRSVPGTKEQAALPAESLLSDVESDALIDSLRKRIDALSHEQGSIQTIIMRSEEGPAVTIFRQVSSPVPSLFRMEARGPATRRPSIPEATAHPSCTPCLSGRNPSI